MSGGVVSKEVLKFRNHTVLVCCFCGKRCIMAVMSYLGLFLSTWRIESVATCQGIHGRSPHTDSNYYVRRCVVRLHKHIMGNILPHIPGMHKAQARFVVVYQTSPISQTSCIMVRRAASIYATGALRPELRNRSASSSDLLRRSTACAKTQVLQERFEVLWRHCTVHQFGAA